MDLDDLWDDVSPIAVGGLWAFAMVLVLIMKRNLDKAEAAYTIGVIELLIVAVVLIPISYVLTRAILNRD